MTLTVAMLRQHLAAFPEDYEVIFQGGLQFYRTKQRGPSLVQIEFNQGVANLSEEFKHENPHVKVCFVE